MTQGFCTAFEQAPEPGKLSQLRAKTDQQLQDLVHSKLDLGLSFAALAEDSNLEANPDRAEQLFRRAEQAVIEVKQLLPVLSDDQQRGFGSTLNELQEALERLDRNLERPRSNTASMS